MHFGRDGKFGYLAMELLDGVSLRLVLDGAETLPLDEVRPVIRSVGEALRFLHVQHMRHGNLTTRNVFITDEFDVRLLDVLPVDPAEALVRGIATNDPFSRCTVADDVFGLACLAYEMLSGKHPFNYTSPAEARLAGLEAERIDSLPDREWQALNLALSFADEQKRFSVADFMRDFGIQGTETIKPPMEQPDLTAVPIAEVDSVSMLEDRRSNARRVDKGHHALRAAFLGSVLAALSAWSYFGQPEEHIVNLFSNLHEPGEGLIEIPAIEPDRITVTERAVAGDHTPAAAPEAVARATPAAATEPEVLVDESVVSVSEGDGAARIAPPRATEPDAPLIWWTSEHTATADTDYISIERKTMAVASFDDSSTLYVPLVNDSVFEPRESFFVSFGRLDTEQGQIDRIATVRVDIIDDDVP